MAKVTANGKHEIAAVTTEREITSDGETVKYRESWKLRSDGAILRRIVWTEREGGRGYSYHDYKDHPNRLRHNSGFSIWRKFKPGVTLSEHNLVALLQRMGCVIV